MVDQLLYWLFRAVEAVQSFVYLLFLGERPA